MGTSFKKIGNFPILAKALDVGNLQLQSSKKVVGTLFESLMKASVVF